MKTIEDLVQVYKTNEQIKKDLTGIREYKLEFIQQR